MLIIGMIAVFLAAALLLFVTSPNKRSAAIKQGFLPLIAVAALGVAVLLGTLARSSHPVTLWVSL